VATTKLRFMLLSLFLALLVDQLTKAWVAARIPAESFANRITLIDGFFYITHARNRGAAFGLLTDWPWAWRITLFVAVAAVALFVAVSFYRTLAPGDRFNAFALGLIMGGGLGNLVDRLLRGEVIDFLHFRLWGGSVWPDFNLADTFLVVGVAALIFELLASEAESRARAGDVETEEADR
jgi:signal peptidase II